MNIKTTLLATLQLCLLFGLLSLTACLKDKPDPVFCEERCVNSFWTEECEETCNIRSRCDAGLDVCPLGSGGNTTGGTADTGGTTETGGTTKTGGTADTGGTTETGGAVTGGNTSGGNTTGGNSTGGNSTGGNSTGGTLPVPCEGKCSGDKGVCSEDGAACVQCNIHDDCSEVPGEPICDKNQCLQCLKKGDCSEFPRNQECDTDSNTCVQCNNNDDCDPSSAKPYCANHSCEACATSADCTEPSAAHCDDTNYECTSCTTHADCEGVDDTTNGDPAPACDPETNTCVQCTRDNATECGKDSIDRPYVCDSLKTTCTQEPEHTASACKPCVADLQCLENQICVMQEYGDPEAEPVYFCLNTNPGVACTTAPFINALPQASSIDGVSEDVCALRASNCIAYNAFSQPCGREDDATEPTITGTPDDSFCGTGASDGFCVDADTREDVDNFQCAPVCSTSLDCINNGPCLDVKEDGQLVCKP